MSGQPVTFSLFSVQDHYPEQPRTIQAFYEEMLEQVKLGEALGYDVFWVAEHHFHEYGVIPNPAIFLAAAARESKSIRLGSAVAVLPFQHPLRSAEDYAMVDILSGGRLVFGVGSGYLKHEFEGFHVDPGEKRDRFDENLAVIRQAWTGEAFSREGRFNHIEDTRINLRPLQQPAPEIYVAVLRKEVAYHVGRAGAKMMSVPYATVDDLSECGEIVEQYNQGWRESGAAGDPPEIAFCFHAYVAESDAAARAEAETAFDNYVRTRLYGKSAGWKEITERRYCLFGSRDTVVERLAEMRGLGITHVMLLVNFGGLAHQRVCDTMRIFAEDVLPRVNSA